MPTDFIVIAVVALGFIGLVAFGVLMLFNYRLFSGTEKSSELALANERLKALDASKSEFVSIAAHQLRTPITGIRWAFSMLLNGEFGPITAEQQKILDEGFKSSVRMAELINDLLNVTRIEEGRFGFKPVRQALGVPVAAAIDRHGIVAKEKGIELTTSVPNELPKLDLDEEKMAIALDNLLDNAIKYTPPGGRVSVVADQVRNRLRLSIQDTGIGVPEGQLNKLFEKFFRADNAQHFQTSGTGLGLFVVKNIIETHGGTIRIESVQNKGTTVIVEFPIPSP